MIIIYLSYFLVLIFIPRGQDASTKGQYYNNWLTETVVSRRAGRYEDIDIMITDVTIKSWSTWFNVLFFKIKKKTHNTFISYRLLSSCFSMLRRFCRQSIIVLKNVGYFLGRKTISCDTYILYITEMSFDNDNDDIFGICSSLTSRPGQYTLASWFCTLLAFLMII